MKRATNAFFSFLWHLHICIIYAWVLSQQQFSENKENMMMFLVVGLFCFVLFCFLYADGLIIYISYLASEDEDVWNFNAYSKGLGFAAIQYL